MDNIDRIDNIRVFGLFLKIQGGFVNIVNFVRRVQNREGQVNRCWEEGIMSKSVCEVCGKPIHTGRVHIACNPDAESYGRLRVHLTKMVQKLEEEHRTAIPVRHWNRAMGRKRLASMFPDMAARF